MLSPPVCAGTGSETKFAKALTRGSLMAKSTGGVGTGVTVGFGVGDCEGVGVAPIMHEGAVVVQPFYIDLHLYIGRDT